MDFIIVAPPFNINKGGALVLHKLCHLLNVMGIRRHYVLMFQSQIILY
ncbi:hypothetical protein BANRA_01588 [Escherichia coli]|nr:hypothetical protein BANRA_01588 [Escherichia coli]